MRKLAMLCLGVILLASFCIAPASVAENESNGIMVQQLINPTNQSPLYQYKIVFESGGDALYLVTDSVYGPGTQIYFEIIE